MENFIKCHVLIVQQIMFAYVLVTSGKCRCSFFVDFFRKLKLTFPSTFPLNQLRSFVTSRRNAAKKCSDAKRNCNIRLCVF